MLICCFSVTQSLKEGGMLRSFLFIVLFLSSALTSFAQGQEPEVGLPSFVSLELLPDSVAHVLAYGYSGQSYWIAYEEEQNAKNISISFGCVLNDSQLEEMKKLGYNVCLVPIPESRTSITLLSKKAQGQTASLQRLSWLLGQLSDINEVLDSLSVAGCFYAKM